MTLQRERINSRHSISITSIEEDNEEDNEEDSGEECEASTPSVATQPQLSSSSSSDESDNPLESIDQTVRRRQKKRIKHLEKQIVRFKKTVDDCETSRNEQETTHDKRVAVLVLQVQQGEMEILQSQNQMQELHSQMQHNSMEKIKCIQHHQLQVDNQTAKLKASHKEQHAMSVLHTDNMKTLEERMTRAAHATTKELNEKREVLIETHATQVEQLETTHALQWAEKEQNVAAEKSQLVQIFQEDMDRKDAEQAIVKLECKQESTKLQDLQLSLSTLLKQNLAAASIQKLIRQQFIDRTTCMLKKELELKYIQEREMKCKVVEKRIEEWYVLIQIKLCPCSFVV